MLLIFYDITTIWTMHIYSGFPFADGAIIKKIIINLCNFAVFDFGYFISINNILEIFICVT